MRKFLVWFTVVIVALGVGFFVVWFYVPYADSGVVGGQLNYVIHKGVVFKTYEGRLIQTGLKSNRSVVQSNEFQFSVEDEELAKKLMDLADENVKLHYKEYFGALPWRGHTKYIVDSIVSVDEHKTINEPIL